MDTGAIGLAHREAPSLVMGSLLYAELAVEISTLSPATSTAVGYHLIAHFRP